RDLQVLQHTNFLQCRQGFDDDDVAALHVGNARALRPLHTNAFEMLERAVGFEHRVQVADEEQVRTLSVMPGDQVTRAAELCTVHPADVEVEDVESIGEELPDLLDSLEIHGATVDLDGLLQQVHGPGLATVDYLGEFSFSVGKCCSICSTGEKYCQRNDSSQASGFWHSDLHGAGGPS